MKRKLFKSLLAVALISAGSNAWAAAGDVTTNANIDFSSSITGTNPYTISGAVGSMTWTQQWSTTPSIVDGILRFGNFDGGEVVLQNNNIGAKDVVTISFDLAFGKLTGKHVGFKFVDNSTESPQDILTQWFDAYNGDFDDSNPLGLDWGEMYRGSNEVIQERCVNFRITIDYANKKITTNTTCYLSGASKPATLGSHTVALPSTTPIGKFVLLGNTNNDARYSTFDNLLIQTTEGDYTAATANYTVNWVFGEDVIKTETRNGDVDASIALLAADMTSFEVSDQRYIYVSDDASSKTIAEEGTTVVTITMRKAAKYNYTATSSFESNPLAWAASGSVWEDQNAVTVQIPRFQTYNGTTLVEATYGSNGALDKSFTVTSDGYTIDYAYNATGVTNLYLLSEAENLGTGIATSATGFTNRVSNKAIIYAASGTLMTLPAGRYKFTLGAIGGDNNTHKVAYTVSAGETQIIEGTCTGNVLTLFTSDEFTLTEPTNITFTCSDHSSQRGIDLVYVEKTAAVVAIGPAGWATLYTEDALDFSGVTGLTAYTATCDGKTVTLTEVTSVPANTGVVLEGAEGSYTIPFAATPASEQGDLEGNATEATAFDEFDGQTLYVLALNGKGDVQFQPVTSGEIAAGKAYLALTTPSSGVKALSVAFGTATGINAVESARQDGMMFNLAGQRVSMPVRGLYIKNGKKVVVK